VFEGDEKGGGGEVGGVPLLGEYPTVQRREKKERSELWEYQRNVRAISGRLAKRLTHLNERKNPQKMKRRDGGKK